MAFGRHDALVAEHLAAFGGGRPKDQGEGDSAFAVFARASDAIGCAVALQRALSVEDWPGSAVIRVRIALHTGEAELANGNYKGSAVHRCARLRGLADGGQIVVSEAVVQIARDQLPDDVTLLDLGVHALRGLVHPEHVYQLCHPELPADFPPLQSAAGRPRDLPSGADVRVPAALQSSGEGAFVGRVAELADLSDAWESAGTRGARIVLIRGEAGIGKSRLAAEFAMTVHERGATVLFGRCDEEALRPYQPFAEALSTYLRALPGDELQYRLGRSAVELGRLVPELTDSVPGLVDTAWSDAESQRFRLFEAVATLLAELAASAPALLVVDDLHWADNATLLLVRHLARHADAGKLVILGTYREENARLSSPFGDMLVTLDRAHVVTHVDVGGLDDAEVADLLEGSTTASRGAMLELAGGCATRRRAIRSSSARCWAAWATTARCSMPRASRWLVESSVDWASRVACVGSLRSVWRGCRSGRTRTHRSVGSRTRIHVDVVGAVTDADEERVLDVLEEAVHSGAGPRSALPGGRLHVLARLGASDALRRTDGGPPRATAPSCG